MQYVQEASKQLLRVFSEIQQAGMAIEQPSEGGRQSPRGGRNMKDMVEALVMEEYADDLLKDNKLDSVDSFSFETK